MVGASDLAFRRLCRLHGADACYTEMLFSERLVAEAGYRERKLRTADDDRPLIVQLCGNEPATVAAAAALVEATCACDALDLNLGCPLPRAREQHFGAWLLEREEWPRVCAIVRAMLAATSLPVCAKIRLLSTVEETIELVDALSEAGCTMVAVHARQVPPIGMHRDQRRAQLADLDAVRQICAARSDSSDAARPLIVTNGNTQVAADVSANLALTGADGLMAAEGLLRNPLLFEQDRALLPDAPTPPHQLPHSPPQSPAHSPVHSPADRCDESTATDGLGREDLARVALEYLALAAGSDGRPAEEPSVMRSHVMWMLGKSGKGERCLFEWLGPYTPQQLRLALLDAESAEQLAAIVRAVLALAVDS